MNRRFAAALVAATLGLALAACSAEAEIVIPTGSKQVAAVSRTEAPQAQQRAVTEPASGATTKTPETTETTETTPRAIPQAEPPPPVDVIGIQDSVGLQWAGNIYHRDRMRWEAPDPVEDYFIMVVREVTPHLAGLGVEAGKAYRYRGGNTYEYIRDVDLALDNDAIANLFGVDDDKPIDVLLQAIESDDPAMARKVLAEGLEPDARNRSDRPVLLVAAGKGSLKVVKVLVEAGAQIDVSDVSGETALHHAARGAHVDVVAYLLEQGAAIECKDRLGHSALFFAAESNSPEMASFLIESGADVSIKDQRGYTALAYARVFLRSRMKPELRELLTPKD